MKSPPPLAGGPSWRGRLHASAAVKVIETSRSGHRFCDAVPAPARIDPMRRGARRRLLFGLQTVLGPGRGAVSSFPMRGRLPSRRRGPLAWVEARFEAALPAFAAAMNDIDGLAPALGAIGGEPPPEPRWDQDWFPRLDAAMLYALARRRPPRRAVEVGSGHSTRFLLRALRDGGAEADVTAIDPAPRADLAGLEDRLTLLRRTVQEAGRQPFEALDSGRLVGDRFQPCRHAGHGRGFPVRAYPAGAATGRAAARPRCLPAGHVSGGLGLAGL